MTKYRRDDNTIVDVCEQDPTERIKGEYEATFLLPSKAQYEALRDAMSKPGHLIHPTLGEIPVYLRGALLWSGPTPDTVEVTFSFERTAA